MTDPVQILLASTGRASDAAFLAASDVAEIATELGVSYRLVGGNAVTLLVAVHGVTELVPGECGRRGGAQLAHRSDMAVRLGHRSQPR